MIRNIFRRGTFASKVAILTSGGGVGQLISVLAVPFLTRIYPPEAFGSLALMVSFYVIVANLATLRYEMAIPLVKDRNSAYDVVGLNFVLSVFFLSLLLISLIPFKSTFVEIFRLKKLGWLVILIPFMAFLEASRNIFKYWFIREEKFGVISLGVIFRNSAAVAGQFTAAVFKLVSAVGLVAGHLIGQIVNMLWLLGNFSRDGAFRKHRTLSIKRMLFYAGKYKNFPLFASWNVLLNTLSVNLPVIFLSMFYPKDMVGFYAVSVRVLNTPLSLLGMSVGQVYYQQISKYLRNGVPIFPFMIRVALKLFGIIAVPMAVVVFVGEPVFRVVLGERWGVSGEIASILVPLYFARFVVTPVSNIFAAVGKQYISLAWQLLYVGTVFTCFYYFAREQEVFFALKLYSWSVATLYIILFVISGIVTRRSDKRVEDDSED